MIECSLSLVVAPAYGDGDGKGEGRLDDGGVEVHCHPRWQVELHLLCILGDGADVQLPLEVLGDNGALEVEGLHSVEQQLKRNWLHVWCSTHSSY